MQRGNQSSTSEPLRSHPCPVPEPSGQGCPHCRNAENQQAHCPLPRPLTPPPLPELSTWLWSIPHPPRAPQPPFPEGLVYPHGHLDSGWCHLYFPELRLSRHWIHPEFSSSPPAHERLKPLCGRSLCTALPSPSLSLSELSGPGGQNRAQAWVIHSRGLQKSFAGGFTVCS